MTYLIPPRIPLTPEQVERGFDYLLALQRGGGAAVAGRVEADPGLAFVLLWLAEDIVWPATVVDGEAELSADSFALDEVGCVLLSALRDWARDSPPRRCRASPAASSGSPLTSFRIPTTRTPPAPWRRCAMSTWCSCTRCIPYPAPTGSPHHRGSGCHRCGRRRGSGVHRVDSVRLSGPVGGAFPVDMGRGQGEMHRVDAMASSPAMSCIHPVDSTQWRGCRAVSTTWCAPLGGVR